MNDETLARFYYSGPSINGSTFDTFDQALEYISIRQGHIPNGMHGTWVVRFKGGLVDCFAHSDPLTAWR